jgi:hypothetical protein
MAGTKRTPMHRASHRGVTPRAVALFKLALTYHDPDHRDPTYSNVVLELQRELGLKVWDEFIVDMTIDDEPPPNLKDQFSIDRWLYVRELRKQLISLT